MKEVLHGLLQAILPWLNIGEKRSIKYLKTHPLVLH
jgi:hypothetical protein